MSSRRGCASKLAKALWYAVAAQKRGVDLSSPKGAWFVWLCTELGLLYPASVLPGPATQGSHACPLIAVASLTLRNGPHGPPPEAFPRVPVLAGYEFEDQQLAARARTRAHCRQQKSSNVTPTTESYQPSAFPLPTTSFFPFW
eukprot:4057964-Pyramimonas_sp.AAC.1